MANPAHIEALLRDGAQRLRATHATPLLKQLREAVGLRDLSQRNDAATATAAKRATPTFKQYREADGRFHFKLVAGDRVLLESEGHASARDAGQLVAAAKQDAGATLRFEGAQVHLHERALGRLPEGVDAAALIEALSAFADQDA